ncbi:uncharacterized protein LOC112051198 [Bicyclus anynana]|uniref:Uncharacterized protein LOC112051198 n=1 Tax=Bicyclus anynana TaxID=110368 RepID=A0A6J1NKH7_BICAN|nr:uncharacterized protein LOC112051198 [Bicyclus anynana]
MEAVKKAKERFAKYPLIYAKCSKQASVYARCVLLREDTVKKDDCAKEFQEFNACLQSASKELKTKI